jgi:hypothetical protein
LLQEKLINYAIIINISIKPMMTELYIVFLFTIPTTYLVINKIINHCLPVSTFLIYIPGLLAI